MADFTQPSDFTFKDVGQVDVPDISANDMKTYLDSQAKELRDYLIVLLAEIKAATDGTSGADKIGMTAITETGANATIQSIIEALITRLKAVADGVSGADLIGATAISGLTGATVQALLEALKAAADGKLPLTGGTLTGVVIAQANTDYTTAQIRNVIEAVGDPAGGGNGDIWIKYTA